MGTLYIVLPLDDEISAWLESAGISPPMPSPHSRNPTPGEILEVLTALPDYDFKVRSNREQSTWYSEVFWKKSPSTGPWTEIAIQYYQGDDIPRRFSFTKGSLEIIMLVTERLTQYCGPLVIVSDSSGIPFLVKSGMDLQTMITEFESQC